jgi:hypothetical protein
MTSQWESDLTKIVASTIRVTSYNKGDSLPFQLVCSENDKITWTCGVDQAGKITEVYSFRGSDSEPPGKKGQYLLSTEEAIRHRDQLLGFGWVPSKMPTARVKYPGMEPIEVGENDSVKLNRRQRRHGAQMLDHLTNEKGHDRNTTSTPSRGSRPVGSKRREKAVKLTEK